MGKVYKKSDFSRISWDEYGEVLAGLHKKIAKFLKQNKLEIDAVIPIMRGGNIPGTYLAYKFNILAVLPIQYKFMYDMNGRKVKLFQISKLNTKKEYKTILVVENNHCFGETAGRVLADVRKKFPKSKILYAAVFSDYSHQKVNADYIFYGELTNETGQLTDSEVRRKKIRSGLTLFPWESLEEEITIMNNKNYIYKL